MYTNKGASVAFCITMHQIIKCVIVIASTIHFVHTSTLQHETEVKPP